tara:strand:+ start:4923 stop:5585 length:663 start_codon:yes stop_codon:yes gene_type:complete
MIFSIEGNVGSGKSTLVNYLKQHFDDKSINGKNVVFLQEPVSRWENIKEPSSGKNIIQLFYENQHKYSFSFQMLAYISRLNEITSALENTDNIIICERSVFTDCNVFAKMLYDTGKIQDVEYQIYNMWFDYFENKLAKHHFIYIRTSPEICKGRVVKRNRKGEENITLDYLKSCDYYHNIWLDNYQKNKLLTIDGTSTELSLVNMCHTIFNFIENSIELY